MVDCHPTETYVLICDLVESKHCRIPVQRDYIIVGLLIQVKKVFY